MTNKPLQEKPINVLAADEEQKNFMRRLGAFKDAMQRSLVAKDKYSREFNDPAHITNVEAALAALIARFGYMEIYENCRENRGKPFTVLKARNPHYRRNDGALKRIFLAELAQIPTRVDPKPNLRSGDYLVRIYCQ